VRAATLREARDAVAGLAGEEEVVLTITANSPASATLRLNLFDGPVRKATLDGGWWPRTADALTELPPLLEALGASRGEITHVLLNAADWDLPHPNRLAPGRRSTRLGWYSSQPAGLVTIMTEFGKDRFDLFVVPPGASPDAAETALSAAADPADERRAPDLLRDVQPAS
jgi:hypothetical protein